MADDNDDNNNNNNSAVIFSLCSLSSTEIVATPASISAPGPPASLSLLHHGISLTKSYADSGFSVGPDASHHPSGDCARQKGKAWSQGKKERETMWVFELRVEEDHTPTHIERRVM